MKIDIAIPVVDDPIARAAERLLERKRIGLESAIEALETVGYAVAVNPKGRYTVTPPASEGATMAAHVEAPRPKAFLEDYPDLLTPAHIAEITGMTAHYTRKLCRDGNLPAVQVGESRWYVPKKKFVDMVMGREDNPGIGSSE